MKIDLTGKRALVTGSTAGIGYAIAEGLSRAGAAVVVNGRGKEKVAQAVDRMKKAGGNADILGVAADLGTAEGAETLYSQVEGVDILVNNLGIFEPKPFFEIPDEDWDRFFRVNVLSAVRMSRHYTPKMVKRGWGRVLFLSSESGIQIPVEMVHYGMTKTALIAVARGLAEAVSGTGVTVNSLLPGPTFSEGVEGFVNDVANLRKVSRAEVEKDFFKTVRPTSLLQRFATTEEVANMAVYLSSEQASATTGSAIRVDGGTANSIL